MDVKEIENGKGYCCKLQVNEIIEH